MHLIGQEHLLEVILHYPEAVGEQLFRAILPMHHVCVAQQEETETFLFQFPKSLLALGGDFSEQLVPCPYDVFVSWRGSSEPTHLLAEAVLGDGA